MEYLETKGADLRAVNNLGLSVVHIASQADQPISLVRIKH